jgi:hypothetical protein
MVKNVFIIVGFYLLYFVPPNRHGSRPIFSTTGISQSHEV